MDLEAEAMAAIEAYRSFLSSPAFHHSVDLAVLVQIAGDTKADPRERRRAAEVLAKLRLQAMEGLASWTGAREKALDQLGLKPGPSTLALTQVNQTVEIEPVFCDVIRRRWTAYARAEGIDEGAGALEPDAEPTTPDPVP